MTQEQAKWQEMFDRLYEEYADKLDDGIAAAVIAAEEADKLMEQGQ